MRLIIIFSCVYIFFLCSCFDNSSHNNEPNIYSDVHHETKEIFDKNGKLTNRYQVNLSGIRDGISYEFFNNGKIKSSSFYKNGLLDSTQLWFYPNGIKQAVVYRLNGNRFGSQSIYDSLGNLEAVYFVTTECDSCITSFLSFNSNGSINEKNGNLIHCIYSKNKIKVLDTAKMVFYVMAPDFFQVSSILVVEKFGDYIKRDSCNLDFINHNKGYFFIKEFNESGAYNIGFVVNILNTKTNQKLSDSIFVPLTVVK